MLNRLPEDLASLHSQIARVARGRGAAVDIEDVVLAAVRMQMVGKNVSPAGRGSRHSFQSYGTCAVTKQHAGAAIFPVENSRKCLGSDDERGPCLPKAKRIVGD